MIPVALFVISLIVLFTFRSRFALAAILFSAGLAMIIFRVQLATPTFLFQADSSVIAVASREDQLTSLCVGLLLGFLGSGLFLIETQNRVSATSIQSQNSTSKQPSWKNAKLTAPECDEPSFAGVDYEELSFQARDVN